MGGYIIYSDRDKGLLTSVARNLSNYVHNNCCFHLYNNCAKMHHRNKSVRKLFFAAAGASTEASFWNYMNLQNENH